MAIDSTVHRTKNKITNMKKLTEDVSVDSSSYLFLGFRKFRYLNYITGLFPVSEHTEEQRLHHKYFSVRMLHSILMTLILLSTIVYHLYRMLSLQLNSQKHIHTLQVAVTFATYFSTIVYLLIFISRTRKFMICLQRWKEIEDRLKIREDEGKNFSTFACLSILQGLISCIVYEVSILFYAFDSSDSAAKAGVVLGDDKWYIRILYLLSSIVSLMVIRLPEMELVYLIWSTSFLTKKLKSNVQNVLSRYNNQGDLEYERRTHADLLDMIDVIDSTIGPAVLIGICTRVALLLISCYSLIRSDEMSFVSLFILSAEGALALILIAESGHKLTNELSNINNTLRHADLSFGHIRSDEFQAFMTQSHCSSGNFTVMHFMTLNRSLLTTILSFVLSYVVILLQFQPS
ncbi:Uncharacterised protein g10853 [Pycnogonum litorale]